MNVIQQQMLIQMQISGLLLKDVLSAQLISVNVIVQMDGLSALVVHV